MTIYAYIRVSSNKQTLEHQEFEIKKFTKNQKIKIDRWVEEKIKYPLYLNLDNVSYLFNKIVEKDGSITLLLSLNANPNYLDANASSAADYVDENICIEIRPQLKNC